MRKALNVGFVAGGYIPMPAERHGIPGFFRPVFDAEGSRGGEAEFKALAGDLKKATDEVKGFAEKTTSEIKRLGGMSEETKAAADKALLQMGELSVRLGEAEQKLARRGDPDADRDEHKSIGQLVVDSDQFKAVAARGDQFRGRAEIEVKNITSASASGASASTALVPTDRRPGVVTPPERRMTVRDLLTPGRTTQASIEWVRETLLTNNAGNVAEGALKPESDITFNQVNTPTRVIAHWIQASKQILSDAPMLQSYIDGRLRYGLAYREELQLLLGDGTGQNLLGIMPQAVAYSEAFAPASKTPIDVLRLAMLQAALAEFPATGHVLNPIDWAKIELTKDAAGGYIIGNPQGTLAPTLWGLPVVATQAMAANNFLVGAFRLGAQIFDRWDATVLISTEDRDNFVKNMVTILAEERLALAVYRPQAFVKGPLVAV